MRSLDQNPHLRTFKADKLPNPIHKTLGVRESFEAARSIDLEIGSGTGQFAFRYASEHPNRYLVGIERTVNKFLRFERKLMESHPANLLACHTDAVSWVAHHLGDKKIDRCFFLYPNPNSKNPHRRWIRSPFFGFLLQQLSDEGEIFFASNLEEYIDDVERLAQQYWQLTIARKSIVSVPARTAFEKKYMERGQTCFEIVLRKTRSLN